MIRSALAKSGDLIPQPDNGYAPMQCVTNVSMGVLISEVKQQLVIIGLCLMLAAYMAVWKTMIWHTTEHQRPTTQRNTYGTGAAVASLIASQNTGRVTHRRRAACAWLDTHLLYLLAGNGRNLSGHVGQGLRAIPVDELLVVVHQGDRPQALAEPAAEDHLTRNVIGCLNVAGTSC